MKQIIVKLIVAVLVSCTGIFLPGQALETIEQRTHAEVLGINTVAPVKTEQTGTQLKVAPEFAHSIGLPEISAKSAIAYDLNSGALLYSKNYDEKVQVASLTKLMTALVAAEYLDYDKIVTVQSEDIRVVGTNMGLLPGEQIRVLDLFKGLLISSSNDASKVLARVAAGSEEKFVALMNLKGAELGLLSTRFSNPVGLDSNDNYSTAHDLMKIVNEFIKNPVFNQIVQTKELEVVALDKKTSHKIRTTNKLLLENPNVSGIKTGFTSLAKGNLVLKIKENSGEIISIVLGSDDREDDTQKLIDWVLDVYKW